MNTISLAKLGLFAIALLIQPMLVDGGQRKLVADQSGTLLMTSPAGMASPKPSTPSPAVTLPEAVSTAPMATESFSTIQFAPAQEPALILPVSTVFGPGQLGFLAIAGKEGDRFGLSPPGRCGPGLCHRIVA